MTKSPRYYDPSAFVLQSAGFYGSLGRNNLIGPGLATVDFSLFKNTTIGESRTLQFRAELFNLLSRANFGLPDRNVFVDASGVPSPTAGRITTIVGSARQIQFSLKFIF